MFGMYQDLITIYHLKDTVSCIWTPIKKLLTLASRYQKKPLDTSVLIVSGYLCYLMLPYEEGN